MSSITNRSFQGETDFPHIHRIITACAQADRLEWFPSLEDITNNYRHLHNSDPQQDMRFVEVDGQTMAYARVGWEITGAGEWQGEIIGYVHPEARRRGIGRELQAFGETRLSAIKAGLIQSGRLPPEAPGFIQAFTRETETAKIALLERSGFRVVRYAFEMVRPDLENIPDLPLPPGVEVRPVSPEHYRTIFDASNEAFRDHWGYVPEPEENYQRMISDPNFDPSLWRVAWEGDQVAGMVLSFINKTENAELSRKRGYTENICVRRPWRKKGLAKALIALSLQAIKERGMDHAALGVDAENISGATHLYELMGYQVTKRSAIYRKPF
jgi:ribosomal protein S18 acetylase RimI-like enzyme